MSRVASKPRSCREQPLPPALSNQLDKHGVILPNPADREHRSCSDALIVAPLRSACLSWFAHSSCYPVQREVTIVTNRKEFFMDMLWLFAGVMGALLIGGLIVYKKSA